MSEGQPNFEKMAAMRTNDGKDEPPKPQWQKPDLSVEHGEIERTAEETGIPLEKLVILHGNSKKFENI